MADVTYKSGDGTEVVRAIHTRALLVVPAQDGELGIYVDVPDTDVAESVQAIAQMGGMVIVTLRDLGLLETAWGIAAHLGVNPASWRATGVPVPNPPRLTTEETDGPV
jgi:hypothetical protein